MPQLVDKSRSAHYDFDSLSNNIDSGSLKARSSRSAGITVGAEAVVFVVRTGGVIVLARLLVPEDFGVVAMVTALFMLLMNFGVNGFSEYTIHKEEVNADETNAIFWLHLCISSTLAGVFAVSGPIIARFYGKPEVAGIVLVMSIGIVLPVFGTQHLALLKRDLSFSRIAMNRIVGVLISTACAIALAAFGAGYWAVVARQLLEIGLIAVGSWFACQWRPTLPINLRLALHSLGYSLRVYANFVLNFSERSVDKILLGRFHSAIALGYYDRAYYLSSRPVSQLTAPLHDVGLATLSRLRDYPDKYLSFYRKALTSLSFIGVLTGAILVGCGKDIVALLFGPDWTRAGLIVVAFGPGIAAMMVYSTSAWVHLSLSRPNRWLRWSVGAVVAKLTAIAVAAPHGGVAVAAAISGFHVVALVPAIWYAARPLSLPLASIVSDIWRYYAAGVLAAGAARVITANSIAIDSFMSSIPLLANIGISLAFVSISYVMLVVLLHWSFEPCLVLWRYARSVLLRRRDTAAETGDS